MTFIVLDKVLQQEIRCMRWITKTTSVCSPLSMLTNFCTSVCPICYINVSKLHASHTVAVFYVHVLCVFIHKHNCVYVFYIYLHSSGRDAKEFFALGFLSSSVAKALLLSSLLLGFKSITEWGTSQGSTIFVF